jgi:hypothetical protein
MKEIEVKILEINPNKIRNLVLKNGGKRHLSACLIALHRFWG